MVEMMQFDKISDMTNNISLNEIMSANPEFLIPLFYLICSIAAYAIIIWHFYRFIAKRDCFQISTYQHSYLFLMVKYFLLYPFSAFLFFTGFSLMILFLTTDFSLSIVLSTSFSIIVAIRLTSYYNEDLSKDVAKMLPFALLAMVLVDPSYFLIEDIMAKIDQLPLFFSQAIQYIILIILVEWMLRFTRGCKLWLTSKRQRRPIKKEIPATT